jgi:hypothetical protein
MGNTDRCRDCGDYEICCKCGMEPKAIVTTNGMTAAKALAVALECIDYVVSEQELSHVLPDGGRLPKPWADLPEARGYIAAALAQMPKVKALHQAWKDEEKAARLVVTVDAAGIPADSEHYDPTYREPDGEWNDYGHR